MKTAAVIAEYNPFHNGHRYHLEQTRLLTGADYIIAVMGGDYMQRGTPAVCDKFLRAKMALQNGADLVLELPLFYATGSAEYFAAGAAALLDRLGVVDALCFGSECGDLCLLSDIAEVLAEEPDGFSAALRKLLKQGVSFPKAREQALSSYFSGPSQKTGSPKAAADGLTLEEAILEPNNILGIEYLRALIKRKSAIRPYTIKRTGGSYHDDILSSGSKTETGLLPLEGGRTDTNAAVKSSATAIRKILERGGELSPLKNHVPDSVFRLLSSVDFVSASALCGDFSLLLKYKLLLEEKKGYTQYVDVGKELSDRIRNNLNRFAGFEEFCALLKTKEITYTRIRRALLHILLDMKTRDLSSFLMEDYVLYARVLGFRKDRTGLLHSIKENASLPLITRLSDASGLLSEVGSRMLEKDIFASQLYRSAVSCRSGASFVSEYSRPLVIV